MTMRPAELERPISPAERPGEAGRKRASRRRPPPGAAAALAAILTVALSVGVPARAQPAPAETTSPASPLPAASPAGSAEPASPGTASPPGPAAASPEPTPRRAAEPPAAPAPAAAPGRELPSAVHSPWAMFLGADLVVKGVMVGLAFASLVTWTIFLAKMAEMTIAAGRVKRALKVLASCRSLAEAEAAFPPNRRDVAAALVSAATAEARMSEGLGPGSGVRDRVATSFQEVIRAEGRRVRLGMGLLATIGSTSPFVGLFGTVWGIMNSFVGIAKAQTTNLAVVAPGIAEALLATAIGLVAAIPAVIVYNHFSRVTRDYLELANRAAGTIGRLLSRDLDWVRERTYPRLAAE